MNPTIEALLNSRQLLNAGGPIGLGLLAFAASRLARTNHSPGALVMAVGATFLLLARLYFIISPYLLSLDVLQAIGVPGIALTIALPPLLLGFGLGGVVGGLWGHLRAIPLTVPTPPRD